jgi:guanylate kinase
VLIVTITGASGAGKSTLENSLTAHFGGGRVVTITTRPPRSAERPGIEYHFESLESLSQRNDLLWKVLIHNHVYAVSEAAFYTAAEETVDLAFVCITPERHVFVREWFEPKGIKTLAIHLQHPGEPELRRRLQSRGESGGTIEKRLLDSIEFEKNALKVPNLQMIPALAPKEVLRRVLELIEQSK